MSAVSLAALAGACEDRAPSGAELASEVAVGSTPGGAREPSEPEPAEPEPSEPEASEETPEPPTPADEEAEFDGSDTAFAVTLEPGEPRSVVESIAESIGATITGAVEDIGVYTLTMDVATEEEREALVSRIQANPSVKAADADSTSDRRTSYGFRGR